MIGTSVAHYRITSKLGEGGMGAVYRAHDTKLGRDVAVKVLPPSLANDADYIARFQREAQVLASLNHPNIAAIYGLEDNAIVMELVEGAELQGPLPVDDAVRIGKQIADALEAAHERGIIHRDLKPANIKITADGTVKVLDFGLAKAMEPAASAASAVNSPTLTLHATTAGVILGTAAYMSPEQATGKPADRRADIWSFGVVLWELVTGRQLFAGETVSHTLAAVLKDDIDFSPIPTGPVRSVAERCLHRDPRLRLQWIGEARLALNAPHAATPFVGQAKGAWRAPAAASLVTALIAAAVAWRLWPAPETPQPIDLEITGPLGTTPAAGSISPDGRSIAFVAHGPGYNKGAIFLRRLESSAARFLPGTEGGMSPAWSPDVKKIAFVSAGYLKTMPIEGGGVQMIAPDAVGRAVRMHSGWLLFLRSSSRILHKVPAQGGVAEPALGLDSARGEVGHGTPAAVDGKRFLFSSLADKRPGTYLASLDGGAPKSLITGGQGSTYVPAADGTGGYIVYRKGENLLARGFVPDSGAIDDEDMLVMSETSSVSAGKHGLLYVPEGPRAAGMRWIEKSGRDGPTIGELSGIESVRLSPDDSKAAVTVGTDIWIVDLARGSSSRLTHGGNRYVHPAWSPDGQRIAYAVEGKSNRIEMRDTGAVAKPEVLLESEVSVRPMQWAPDGKWLLYMAGFRGLFDIYFLPLTGDRKPVPVAVDAFDKYSSGISPDGRWIAYSSVETGHNQVYIVPVPGAVSGVHTPTGRWTVSTTGGSHPVWRGDIKTLYFQDNQQSILSVSIETAAGGVSAGIPEKVLDGVARVGGPAYVYDVTRDGRRFLVIDRTRGQPRSLRLLLNWQSRSRKQQ